MSENAEVKSPRIAGRDNTGVPVIRLGRLASGLTALGLACIGSTGGCGGDIAVVDVASIPTTVTVTPGQVQMTAIGDAVRLSVEIRDQHGWVIEAPGQVQWTSGDPAVAVVDGGVVRAAGNGETSITATAGSASGTAAVTVAQEVSAVAVTPSADTLFTGDTLPLAAEATDANGHAVSGAGFSWASGDTAVAVVDSTGLVTAVGAGEVEIAATSSGVAGSAALTVSAPVPPTVAVTPDTVMLTALGHTVQLKAEVRDQAGRVMAAVPISWSSADTAVAVVDASGLVAAAGNGTATITATAGLASGTATVTVTQVVSTVDVSPDRSLLDVGDTVRLSADVRDANGHAVEDAAVSWTSSDLSVARVDSAGLVTALAKGEAVVAASSDAERDAVNIMVFGRRNEAALAALYMAADGPNWTNSDGWLSGAPLGEWYGVETDAEGRVASLDLNGNQLRGTLAGQLGDLDRLEYLDLGFNRLTGVIPAELAGLSGLTRLYLNENGLSGPVPAELGDLSDLVHLDLGYNELTGAIPAQLGNLTNVTRLALNHNDLSGPVPAELGNLSDLALLGLGSNQLTGPIPEEIASLEHLEVLSLSGNDLSGNIPASLGGMDELWSLRLDGNQLTGSIPSELGGLDALVRLDVSSNALTGPIPGTFGDLASLEYLDLSFNDLTDSIPAQLGGLARLTQMYLDDNDLSGTVPSQFSGLDSLRVLVLDDNALLEGALPLELTSLTELRVLTAEGTDLCAPSDPAFVRWLDSVRWVRVAACGS